MASSAAPLTSSFCSTHGGASGDREADPALEAALRDFAARGALAWPEVPLEASTFAAYLGERADAAPVAWLGDKSPGDLFLACACAKGVPQGLRAFHAAFIDSVEGYLRALRPTPQIVVDTKQELLEKLFVGAPGKPPTIVQYRGQGALGGWVRICAVRVALDLQQAERPGGPFVDEAGELARAIVPDCDPELDLIRASCRDSFASAFREAMASLSRRDRSLLRFTFVEGVPPARIGAMYGVHRTTAMRWIEAAQEDVLARTRARMMETLRLTPSECDRVVALVKSRIDLSLTALLKTAPEDGRPSMPTS